MFNVVLVDGGLMFDDIDYVNVYGIVIVEGDLVEVVVLKVVFGEWVG